MESTTLEEKEAGQKQRRQRCLHDESEVSIGSDWVKQFLDMSDEELYEVVSSDEVKKPINVDDDDCVILDGDPEKEVMHVNDSPNGSDELLVVGEKGQIACRDYPHPRHLCATFPYDSTPHERYCAQCHCYVCDSPAPCLKWGNGLLTTDHCHATDKSATWKTLRKDSKLVKTAPLPVSTNNGAIGNVVNSQHNILPSNIEHLSSNSMLAKLKSRSKALHSRPVNLTTLNQVSHPRPVHLTTQNQATYPRPVHLTTLNQATYPRPVHLTTQNQVSHPHPVHLTTQNQATHPRPVHLTTQNQATYSRPVHLTTQNQVSHPRPVHLTTQNQATYPHSVHLTTQNQATYPRPVHLITQNQATYPRAVYLTTQNQATYLRPVNLTTQNQATYPRPVNLTPQNQASRPITMNACSSQRSKLQNQALRSTEMHSLSVNQSPQNQASRPITMNASNALSSLSSRLQNQGSRSNKTHPLSENLVPHNQASRLITTNAISSLTSSLQNQSRSNNVLGRSTGPSFTIPNGTNNGRYQESGTTLVTNKHPSHAASRMSLGVQSHVIQKNSGHRIGIGNTAATNRVTPLGASGFINRVNPQHGDTNHAQAIDSLPTQPNHSPANETQPCNQSDNSQKVDRYCDIWLSYIAQLNKNKHLNEHQIGSENENIINSGGAVQNVFQQKPDDGGIENEGLLAKDSNTNENISNVENLVSNAKESNTPSSGNSHLSLDEIKHWLLDSN
ncbi:uncharacterized protein LOC131612422 [Vicia villosa]|uniref:uncharacterized protein LOC131612422 n=1 Tax=Vicia villosa TaxID=3911 RepID=UPI00273B673D|nr:uncharacterized protein LOC131612422 [Vicia villosa]